MLQIVNYIYKIYKGIFMFNKKNIILLVLSFSFLTNSFSGITKAESEYYKINKWDFMEKEFVGKVNYLKTSYDKYNKIFYLAPLVLPAAVFLSDDKMEDKIKIYLAFLCISSVISHISFLAYSRFVEPRKKIENLSKALMNFLNNYDSDLNSKLETNYRDFVPEELLSSFDEIHKLYLVNRTKGLVKSIGILFKLRDKIFYDVKKEKYRKPIIVKDTNYVFLTS